MKFNVEILIMNMARSSMVQTLSGGRLASEDVRQVLAPVVAVANQVDDWRWAFEHHDQFSFATEAGLIVGIEGVRKVRATYEERLKDQS